jgi:predicted TIM-barrel fold metal-dependent hydrolase
VDAIERAQALLDEYAAVVRAELPEGADVFDAHTHLGTDIDGMVGDLDELLDVQRRAGISRSFVFCLDEPDRHPGFRAANDRTLDYAARSSGALIPFVRLDLNESPIEEARRCLDRGARGIKLHPRAQKFDATDERLAPVFEIAAERRVPILIHGGRGLPPIAAGLRRLVERYAEATLIIAHAGIADLAQLAECMAGRRGVLFDTSTWSPLDLLDFYRLVPPEQAVYASDFPYGQQPSSLWLSVKTALAAGFDEAQLRALLAGTANALADGRELPEPTRPVGDETFSRPLQLIRVHQYLSMTTPLLWTRQADSLGVLGLAINTCAERNGHVEEMDRVRELLEAARDVWSATAAIEDEAERWQTTRLVYRLIHLADVEAVTAGA